MYDNLCRRNDTGLDHGQYHNDNIDTKSSYSLQAGLATSELVCCRQLPENIVATHHIRITPWPVPSGRPSQNSGLLRPAALAGN